VELAGYRRDGYLMQRGVLPDDLLDGVRRLVGREVDRLAHAGVAAGTITDTHPDLPVEQRLIAVCPLGPPTPRHFDRLLFSPEVCAVMSDPGLTDVLAAVLGPNVTYQGNGHLRAHLPGRLDPVPWHQDAQFYGAGVEGMAEHMAQVWIPLVDAPAERGCLAVVPGSHHWGLQPEAVGGSANVSPSSVDIQQRIYRANAERVAASATLPLPMRRGDVLVFHTLLLHTGTENTSSAVRWSMDLRFEATYGTRELDEQARGGYAVMHRRLRGRGYVPLAVRDGSGRAEGWRAWQRRRDEIAVGRWRP
jgi:hypothetical protein